MGFERRSFGGRSPVAVGDELEVKIEAVGEKGDGIAKKDGFVIFVPNTKEGDSVNVKITKVFRKVGFAEVVGQAEKTEEGAKEGVEAVEAPAEPAKKGLESAPEDTEDFGDEAEPPEPPAEEKEFVESISDEEKEK